MQARSSALRQLVAVCLMLALTLGGVGRGLAAASDAQGFAAALTAPICHAGSGDASRPLDPAPASHHDCCDQCALGAPAIAPAVLRLTQPVAVEHVAEHATGLAWAPALARVRTPRLSQGPPAA